VDGVITSITGKPGYPADPANEAGLVATVEDMNDKRCFVVMPYGTKPVPDTDRTFDFDKVYRVVMMPAIRAAGFEPLRADESASSGLIHSEMFQDLRDRTVVLVDLSLGNPNVFYELGARHVMAQRGTVLMCVATTQLPFDVALSRVIHYDYDGIAFDWDEAERVKPLITAALREAATQPDSPVHAMLDRVLQESTAAVELQTDARVANAESDEVLRQYAAIIAGTLPPESDLGDLISEHAGSRLGVLALAAFCRSQPQLPDGSERVASRLAVYSQYALSAEIFGQLDREDRLAPWRYMQFGSAVSELQSTQTSAEEGLEIQLKGLKRAERELRESDTDENLWNYAYCLHEVGAMHEWLWRLADRNDDKHLTAAITSMNDSVEQLAGRTMPAWVNFVARSHLKMLYLLRARDGRTDRPDDEGHLASILALNTTEEAKAESTSSLGWYKVVAHVERGSQETARRSAVAQLTRDARLEADEPTFNRAQLYFMTRRMMSANADYQRHPSLWDQIAQLLKDASVPTGS